MHELFKQKIFTRFVANCVVQEVVLCRCLYSTEAHLGVVHELVQELLVLQPGNALLLI